MRTETAAWDDKRAGASAPAGLATSIVLSRSSPEPEYQKSSPSNGVPTVVVTSRSGSSVISACFCRVLYAAGPSCTVAFRPYSTVW